MTRIRLDDRSVAAAERRRHSRVLWDSELPGFGCRVPPAGNPAFVAYFRTPLGMRRVVTIGRLGNLSCEEARRIARDVMARDGVSNERGPTAHEELSRQIRAI